MSAPTPPDIEDRIVDFSTSVRFDGLPEDVRTAAKRVLTDTLACAFGALDCEPARLCESAARAVYTGEAVASVVGGRAPISLEGATLVNGVLARYLDLNDVFVGRDPCHPSECIPSALACAEAKGLDGRRLIEAIVIGYEAQLAIIDAFSFSDRGFHSLSCAGYAVPLIAGRLWGLPPNQVIEAMGTAGPRQFCLLAINSGPISMVKAFPYAQNAVDALLATRLAASGFTGAKGTIAWFAKHVKGVRPDRPFTIGGGDWRLTRVGLKAFPLQFELQTVAEAGVSLHASAKDRLARIRTVDVDALPRVIDRTGGPSRYAPASKETADHSLPVCLAMALLDGDVTIRQFDEGRWKAPDVLALASKIVLHPNPQRAAAEPDGSAVRVALVFDDGARVSKEVTIAEGDPRRPLSRESLSRKFVSAAEPHLGARRAEEALGRLDALDTLSDVRVLTRALQRA
jgi:2-methylcitrate dehydratase